MSKKTSIIDDGIHRFNIFIKGDSEPKEGSEYIQWNNVKWGDEKGDIHLNFHALQGQLPSFLSPEDEDVLLVALAIAHADRRAKRGNGHAWCRDILVRIPVTSPDKWVQPIVMHALKNCLELATRDSWQFEFYPRNKKSIIGVDGGQASLPFIDAKKAMPYSDGLDSRATWDIIQPEKLLAITIRLSPATAKTVLKNNRDIVRSWIDVMVCVGGGNHSETSYRTRSLLFFTICAVVARRFDIDTILAPETGQGAIGAAMIPWGNDYGYYGSHPLFTRYLQTFLSHVFENESPKFEHPNVWKTKGYLLKEWANVSGQLKEVISETYSCSRDYLARWRGNVSDHRDHCGICPNCLLRRLALVSANMDDIHALENYIWKDLSKPCLEATLESMHLVEPRNNVVIHPSSKHRIERDQVVASSSFILHRDFANMADNRGTDRQVLFHTAQIAYGLGLEQDECLTLVRSLIQSHSEEWHGFVGKYIGRNSWFKELMG